MANIQSIVIKNKRYEGTRLTIVGSHSSTNYYHYSEAVGHRYFVNPISSTASPTMESVTFDGFLSFTSSNTGTWTFDLVPMETGSTCIIDNFIVEGFKSDTTGQFLMQSMGCWRHTGSSLTKSGMNYQYINDGMVGATAYFTASGTSSIQLVISGVSAVVDWDVHIRYIKSYHTLVLGGGGGNPSAPYYPPPNPLD